MESQPSHPDPPMKTPESQRKQPPPMAHSSLDQNSPILPNQIKPGVLFRIPIAFSDFKGQYKLMISSPSGSDSQTESRSQSNQSTMRPAAGKSKRKRKPRPQRRLSNSHNSSLSSIGSFHSDSSTSTYSDSAKLLNESFQSWKPLDTSTRSESLRSSSKQDSTVTDTESCFLDQFVEEQEWQFGTFPDTNVDAGTEDGQKIMSSWNDMKGKRINGNETFEERFETLKRERRSQKRVAETTQTQPFVNGVLRAFFKIYLKEHHRKHDTTDYSLNSSLYLFYQQKVDESDDTKLTTEEKGYLVKTRTNNVPRIPDAAFFRRGTPVGVDKEIVKFDSAALRCGLVSVEAKANLKYQNMKDAFLECQRDHAHASDKYPSNRMRVGFSIITDGVEWFFLYIKWKRCESEAWKQSIHLSKKIVFDWNNNAELAKWLLFILQLSLTEPKLPTDLVKIKLEGLVSLTKILQSGKRSNVSVWERVVNDERECFVLKYFNDNTCEEEKEKDYIEYCKREFRFLSAIARTSHKQNIVKLLNNEEEKMLRNRCFWLNYGGTPLQYLDICGKRGQQLAVIVKRDIWDGALATLKAHKICHGDIHEKNVLVCLKSNKATLIDFESAKEFENDLADSPVRHKFYSYEKAVEEIDIISVAALLHFLWDPLITDFELDGGLKDYMKKLKEKNTNSYDDIINRISTNDAVPRDEDHGAYDEANSYDEGTDEEDGMAVIDE